MSDYEILLEELDRIKDKWSARLNYQGKQGKDTFDCLLCSTVMYEIERAIQAANIRSAEERQKKIEVQRAKKASDE